MRPVRWAGGAGAVQTPEDVCAGSRACAVFLPRTRTRGSRQLASHLPSWSPRRTSHVLRAASALCTRGRSTQHMPAALLLPSCYPAPLHPATPALLTDTVCSPPHPNAAGPAQHPPRNTCGTLCPHFPAAGLTSTSQRTQHMRHSLPAFPGRWATHFDIAIYTLSQFTSLRPIAPHPACRPRAERVPKSAKAPS